MSAYLTRRLAGFALNLFFVSIFVFTLLRLIPGDAAANILGQEASPENLEKFREAHGLNGSWFEQYTSWAGGILQGDFGKSLWSHTSVTSTFFERLPITLEIVLLSFTFTLIFGISAGILSALKQNSVRTSSSACSRSSASPCRTSSSLPCCSLCPRATSATRRRSAPPTPSTARWTTSASSCHRPSCSPSAAPQCSCASRAPASSKSCGRTTSAPLAPRASTSA